MAGSNRVKRAASLGTCLFVGAIVVASMQKEASAGKKLTDTVTIDPVARTANGSLGSARNSESVVEYIGCSTWSALGAGGPANMVTCQARESGSNGDTAVCTSFNVTLVTPARAINGDSYISFDWDSAGNCTSLYVNNDSQYEPKDP